MTTAISLGIAVTSNADKASIDLDKLAGAAVRAEAGVDRLSAAAVRTHAATSQMAVNSANVAAQLQDVFVSAQMGMNPLTVALQQGTQLSAALGAGGLKGTVSALSAAFASVISPVSLLTIGLIGLGTFGLQALGGLVHETETATEALDRHGDELSKIVAGYDQAEDAIDDFIATAQRLPREAVQIELGASFKEMAKEAAQFEAQARQFGPIFSASLNSTDQDLGRLLTSFTEGRTTAQDMVVELTRLSHVDMGPLGFFMKNMVGDLLEGAKQTAALYNAYIGLQHAAAGTAWNGGIAMALNSMVESQRSAEAHRVELDAINAKTPAQLADIARRRERLKLVDEEITEALREQKVREAGEIAFAQATARGGAGADRWGNSVESFRQRIAQQQTEIGLIGQSTFEIERQRAALDLLGEAKRAGIPITASLTESINQMATEYASATVELERTTEAQRRQNEEMEFYKSTFRSFFADIKSNLREGATGWEAFADAGASALDRIADRALGMAADGIFDMIFGAIMGGITGGVGGSWNIPTTYQPGGFFPGFASGTTSAPGGLAWVGEEGPELVRLPGGAQVFDSRRSMGMAANQNQANDNGTTVNITFNMPNSTRESVSELKQFISSGGFHAKVREVIAKPGRAN